MPLTFPSHAAAVLPFYKSRRLYLSALVIGTCAPDLPYMLSVKTRLAHQAEGIFLLDVPLGLLVFLWAELLIVPTLLRTLPCVFGVELARFVKTKGLPKEKRGWLWVVLSVALGALTHIAWDGFTHTTFWPARDFYRTTTIPLFGAVWDLTRLLQYLSSAIGLVIVILFLKRRYGELPPAKGGERGFGMLCAITLCASACASLVSYLLLPALSVKALIWVCFWRGVLGGMLGVTLGCLVFKRISR